MKKKWCGICKNWALHDASGCPRRKPLTARPEIADHIECGQCAGFDGDDCIIEGSPRFRKKTMNHWKGCGKFKQADASCFEE